MAARSWSKISVCDRDFEQLLAERDAVIAAQVTEIEEHEALVDALRARLRMNLLNGSLAPSRDDKEAREKRRAKATEHAWLREGNASQEPLEELHSRIDPIEVSAGAPPPR